MKNLIITALIMVSLNCFGQDFSELYEQLNPSVVTIYTSELVSEGGSYRNQEALGSGILIDSEGLILTASHVVHTADAIIVSFADGISVQAEIVASVPSADIALIKLTEMPPNRKIAKLGDSSKAKIGEQVLVIGAPLGLEHSLSIGHISGRINRNMVIGGQMMEFLQTDAAINHGNSGGPMFNTQGEVIGIVSFIMSQGGGFDGIGFAAAINPTKKILWESQSFWTGFDGLFLNEELAKILNVPQKSGVLIQHVLSNSIAEKIGLRGGIYKIKMLGHDIWIGGDIILSIQGTTCDSPHNFNKIKAQLEALQPGDDFILTILRAGNVMELFSTIN